MSETDNPDLSPAMLEKLKKAKALLEKRQQQQTVEDDFDDTQADFDEAEVTLKGMTSKRKAHI